MLLIFIGAADQVIVSADSAEPRKRRLNEPEAGVDQHSLADQPLLVLRYGAAGSAGCGTDLRNSGIAGFLQSKNKFEASGICVKPKHIVP